MSFMLMLSKFKNKLYKTDKFQSNNKKNLQLESQ